MNIRRALGYAKYAIDWRIADAAFEAIAADISQGDRLRHDCRMLHPDGGAHRKYACMLLMPAQQGCAPLADGPATMTV